MRRASASGPAQKISGAGGGFHDAGEDLEGRGLARAVRPDQAEDLALLTSKLIPRTASVSPYFFERFCTRMAAPEEGGHPSP